MIQTSYTHSASKQTLDDQELAREAQNGDMEAFTILYERYIPFVYNRVRYRIPVSDVEDVTQEVFLSVMRSLKSFKGNAKFRTWLRTLTNRRIADYYRKRNDDSVSFDQTESEESGAFSKIVSDKGSSAASLDEKIMLQRALNALPEHYQEVILLRFAEGLQFKEIAELRGQSLEATKSLFRRAIAAMREQTGEISNA